MNVSVQEMKETKTNLSRRNFLKLTRDALLWLSGALALDGLIRFLGYEASPAPKTEFEVGTVDDFPSGSRTLLAEIPAMLIHSPDGFVALSLVCTHLGCTLEANAQGFACPCHGSAFDDEGKVTHGPASKSLRTLRVEVDETGIVRIYTQE